MIASFAEVLKMETLHVFQSSGGMFEPSLQLNGKANIFTEMRKVQNENLIVPLPKR